ncbi:MAG: hypothetical protein BAJATHORv1_40273 [Candidatus Thorarchaeota archaeon]|nr:MAG: hypothetical protein BAJATHORv1_40273 [Candidatus Thorarchaeota archaeon]
MDTHAWRRELDKLADLKGILISLNPSLEENVSRQVRHLFDVFASLTKLEQEVEEAGFLKKRKVEGQFEKVQSEFEEDFMRVTRDFGDLSTKEHRKIMSIVPNLQTLKPKEASALKGLSIPSVGTGQPEDLNALYQFMKKFSSMVTSLHEDFAREVKSLLDENKRIVETYERHITIDRGEVTTTISNDDVSHMSLADLIRIMEKLQVERTYLDGRKDEVGRMLTTALMTDVEALQAYVETAAKIGLDLPMDFTQKLRILARDASKASNLTTLISLENQLQTARLQMGNMLRDKIINLKHEITTKIVAGGIPTTSDIIPEAPTVGVEGNDIANLLASYQKMVEWTSQVRISLKQEIEESLEELAKATDKPDDCGIDDVLEARKDIAEWKKNLSSADIDGMIKIYLKASEREEEYRTHVTDLIKSYITRFNELATSADRVLDYAQLSKKAPKVEDLEGGIVFLLESLKNLRQAVESGVATFREACQQEIDAIVQDLQTIKPQYAEIFMPINVELEEGSLRIQGMNEFSEIRSEMRTIKDTILAKAKDALENLRYRLQVKIRLAAAKLMGAGVEIPGEIQEAISELNNVGVAADNVFSLPAIARRMIELYEHKITDKILEVLEEEVDGLLGMLEKAQSIGVDVDKEIGIVSEIKESPPEELDEAADAFDKLENLTTSEAVHKKVRSRANDAYRQIKDAVSIFEEQGMSDFVQRLSTLLDRVPSQLSESSKHVNEALDVCLTLANIQEEMLDVIKGIAAKDKEAHDKDIRAKSKYYSTIERVYKLHPDDFSRLIFDLKKMDKLEQQLKNAKSLDNAIEWFNELSKMRVDWVEKAAKMDDWHKSLRVYMAGFSASASADERSKFIDDSTRKIRETFSREDISSYLSWAVQVLVRAMVETRG